MTTARRSALLVLAATAVALGLVGLVGLDYRATRGELVGLLREQAHALRESVAAAARSNRAASAFAAARLGERLLDRAQALADLDREGGLTPAALQEVSSRDPLLRIALFGPDGSREDLSTAPAPDGERGGRGPRAGWTSGGGGPRGGPGGGPTPVGAGAAAEGRAAAGRSFGRSSRKARTRW